MLFQVRRSPLADNTDVLRETIHSNMKYDQIGVFSTVVLPSLQYCNREIFKFTKNETLFLLIPILWDSIIWSVNDGLTSPLWSNKENNCVNRSTCTNLQITLHAQFITINRLKQCRGKFQTPTFGKWNKIMSCSKTLIREPKFLFKLNKIILFADFLWKVSYLQAKYLTCIWWSQQKQRHDCPHK